ncbi:DUF2062 domain-containing protein [Paenibacillus sp. J2TS4]|uniref:DUF2062 domain-containing protein n=1 Tax=Paenibacillus sp. J2TS4 TaxID=2807194 RepID=UPI001B272BCC|nr:DUF2062 domain-containing protein [Paenibacillus sp. J2TS4]GIP35872.1 hypothetical protein J2TS4_50820 [Paenibacillus sp. J2TS4]
MKLIRRLKYYTVKLFRVNKGAHQVSIGLVTGFFPCWFPTFGIGPALSIAFARLAKGNLPASIIAASIGSIIWPVLFYMNYVTGRLLFHPRKKLPDFSLENMEYVEAAVNVNKLGKLGIKFVLGGVVNSLVFSLLGYAAFYYIFRKYRLAILKLISRRNKVRLH